MLVHSNRNSRFQYAAKTVVRGSGRFKTGLPLSLSVMVMCRTSDFKITTRTRFGSFVILRVQVFLGNICTVAFGWAPNSKGIEAIITARDCLAPPESRPTRRLAAGESA